MAGRLARWEARLRLLETDWPGKPLQFLTHSLEEFKEARWREVSAVAGFREIRSFCSDN